jgi:hypothetical protein
MNTDSVCASVRGRRCVRLGRRVRTEAPALQHVCSVARWVHEMLSAQEGGGGAAASATRGCHRHKCTAVCPRPPAASRAGTRARPRSMCIGDLRPVGWAGHAAYAPQPLECPIPAARLGRPALRAAHTPHGTMRQCHPPKQATRCLCRRPRQRQRDVVWLVCRGAHPASVKTNERRWRRRCASSR